MEKLKKHQTIPLINGGTKENPNWLRIGYSTIFDLALNPNTKEEEFIKDEGPTSEVTHYKPSLPQELSTMKGDPAFDYIYEKYYSLPTGEAVKEDVLIVFAGNYGTEDKPVMRAWRAETTLILNNFNTVDEKITFDLNFNGTIDKGSVVKEGETTVFASGILQPAESVTDEDTAVADESTVGEATVE